MSSGFEDLFKDILSPGFGGDMSAQDKLRITEKALEHYKQRTKDAEDALLSLVGMGGSEFFVKHGEGYRIDVKACLVYIMRTRDHQLNLLKKVIIEAKRLQQIYG